MPLHGRSYFLLGTCLSYQNLPSYRELAKISREGFERRTNEVEKAENKIDNAEHGIHGVKVNLTALKDDINKFSNNVNKGLEHVAEAQEKGTTSILD